MLKPGESKTDEFSLTPSVLQSISDEGKAVQPTGDYHIYIGGSLPTKRSEELGMGKCAEAVLSVK